MLAEEAEDWKQRQHEIEAQIAAEADDMEGDEEEESGEEEKEGQFVGSYVPPILRK